MKPRALAAAVAISLAASVLPASARVFHFQPRLWVTLDGRHYVLSPSPGVDFFGPVAMPLNYATGPNLKDCHRPNNAAFVQGTALWYMSKGPMPVLYPTGGWSFQVHPNGDHHLTIQSATGDVICASESPTPPPELPQGTLLNNGFES